jgi:hypothetical protein
MNGVTFLIFFGVLTRQDFAGMSKKKLIRVLFLIILLQIGIYYLEFAKYL